MTVTKGKNKKKAIVAIARKLAELLYSILKNETVYEEKKYYKPTELAKQALSA